ncbi:MAG: protein-glutamate O-methyltransferase CheR [Gemmatimonadaceae bacterium]|nr:protein-glutamate O-methyltransferase CheR [Gemmatimonadaceae bacterium]
MTGEVAASDEAGFRLLTEKIARERRFGCASYKEKCLRRRIAVRMRARGVHAFADYAQLLDADAREYDRLIDALTINVTRLFRNREVYEVLERIVIPTVWSRPDGPLRVWSAGCSSGEEPYSLAVLFHLHASRLDEVARLSRLDVLGTDIDRVSLENAARGGFDAGDFAETPEVVRTAYFGAEPPFTVRDDVRRMVRFATVDLLHDPAPPGPHHLILCRNVLIYFDRDSQERLFSTFFDALAPGGFLVLGKVETLLGDARRRFTAVDARERIFQKP